MENLKYTVSVLCFIVAMAISGQNSWAVLIDFEDTGAPLGGQINPPSGVGIVSGGFNFDPGPDNTSGLNDLHIHNENGIGDNGSIHLGSHDDLVLSLTVGVFSIQSFSFAGHLTEGNVEIVGQLLGGGSITDTFLANGIASEYQTFMFSNAWMNLTSVTFNYLGNGANGFFVDDILVNSGTAIPEPSTVILFFVGLIGVGFAQRRSAL